MKFWQNISWIETDQLIEVAKFAEQVGFEGVLDGDHVAFPEPLRTPYPYTADGKPPMNSDWNYPDNFACAAAIAAVTTRLRYATDIFVLPARNPLMVAKAAGTVAILGNHRFILGIAAGWMKDEFDLSGVDFATRGKRMDEMIVLMRKLWMGGPVEHHGAFFDIPPLNMEPSPKRLVPIYAGGASKPALRRAATLCDGWLNAGNTPDELVGLMAELSRMRKEAGRDHLPFESIVTLTTPPSLDDFKRAEDAGVDGILAYPPTFTLGHHSTLDQKKAVLEQYAENFIRKMS
jgi:probable F420-dependent oxidoreductase